MDEQPSVGHDPLSGSGDGSTDRHHVHIESRHEGEHSSKNPTRTGPVECRVGFLL